MAEVGLRLHPTKTTVVYCKDGRRPGSYERTEFTFLGFTFRARGARSRAGVNFTGFGPAISKHALTKVSAQVRRWRLHVHTGHTLAELARTVNPIVRGWLQYTGRSTAVSCIHSCGASMPTWCAGSDGNTDDSDQADSPGRRNTSVFRLRWRVARQGPRLASSSRVSFGVGR